MNGRKYFVVMGVYLGKVEHPHNTMIHGKVEMIAHEHDTDSQLKKKLQHKLEVKWKTKITIYQMEIIDRVFLPEQRLIELAKWDRKTVKTALRLE